MNGELERPLLSCTLSRNTSLNRYQTDNEVNVSIFVKNVKADDLKVDLHLRSVRPYHSRYTPLFVLMIAQVSVNIRLPTGSDLVFDLDPLSHEIDPSRSSFRPLTTKVELRLSKAKAAIKWAKLEGEEAEELAMSASANLFSIAGYLNEKHSRYE